MRNTLLLILLTVMLGCSTASYQQGYYANPEQLPAYEHTFNDSMDLPYNLIISDKHLQEENRIFLLNQNWISQYSKLVEYDLTTNTVLNEIAAYDGRKEKISEHCNNDSLIVFVTTKIVETKTYKDIFYYNFIKNKLVKIKTDIIASDDGKYANKLFISLYDNHIYWLNPNLAEMKTEIVKYDIFSKATTVIMEKPHLISGFLTHFPIKYITVQDNLLLFNVRSSSKPENILIYNLNNLTKKYDLDLPTGSEKTYNSIYNTADKNLYIYGNSGEEEVIYRFNPETGEQQNLVGIYPQSNLYKDRMQIVDNNLLYSIQINTSGYIQDHYFSQIYDLETYQMLRYPSVFHLLETEAYFGMLKFDEVDGPNKIHLELYKK